jgi:S1-C subfamily serine protease
MIEEVAPGSELAQRIDAGSIIVEVEDLPVRNVEEFLRVLGDYDLRFPGVLAAVIAPDGTRAVVTLRVQ